MNPLENNQESPQNKNLKMTYFTSLVILVFIALAIVVIFLGQKDDGGLSEAEKQEIINRLREKSDLSEAQKQEIINRSSARNSLSSEEKNEIIDRLSN